MLKFRNGKFKIMQIADVQDTWITSQDTINFIGAAIDKEKPDLVIFTGDQVKSYGITMLIGNKSKNIEKTIRNILEPVISRNVPFTFTYGNHDVPYGAEKHDQTKIYESYPLCVNSESFSTLNSTDGICLTIHSEKDDSIRFAIALIDSQAKTNGKYDGVNEEQIAWTERTLKALTEANNGQLVPTLVFQHIPVYEMYEILKCVDKDTPGAIEGNSSHREKYYTVTDEMAKRGEYMKENIACPDKTTRQFESWVSLKSVLGAFFGHDHINCFIGNLRGVDLGYTPGAGFNVYGPGYDRAVRIFELNENSTGYRTRIVTYRDVLGEKVKNKLKFFIYEHAPSSVDAAMPLIKKAGIAAATLAAAGIAAGIIKSKIN